MLVPGEISQKFGGHLGLEVLSQSFPQALLLITHSLFSAQMVQDEAKKFPSMSAEPTGTQPSRLRMLSRSKLPCDPAFPCCHVVL